MLNGLQGSKAIQKDRKGQLFAQRLVHVPTKLGKRQLAAEPFSSFF